MAHYDHVPTLSELVRKRIECNIEVKQKLLADLTFQRLIVDVAMQMVRSIRAQGKVFFFGNGGSAADAQHLAAEFTGRYLKERGALPGLALNANTSSLTAIANDYGFERVFARQLEAFGRPGDIAVGITTSGNSPNVVQALQVAKSKSIFSVVMTGNSGGIVQTIADRTICIPSCDTSRIQECHILTGHIICEIVERLLFGQCEDERSITAAQSAFAAASESAS
jgi:D-sedoheptulose 7-phosphate isomerase